MATSTGPLQAKLAVSAPGDAYEQEADRVAEQVVRTPDSGSVGVANGASPLAIRRMCASCAAEEEDSKLQRLSDGGRLPAITAGTESRIASLRSSGGTPLSPPLRSYFESRFGHDFSNVRLHHGSEAARAAREVHAHAFTVGRDVVFASGAPRPDTRDGRQLLAHELVHTVQQGAAGSRGTLASAAPIAARMPLGTVAGFWAVENSGRMYPDDNSKTDGQILGEAFHEICDDAVFIPPAGIIQVLTKKQSAGCKCLADIEEAQSGRFARQRAGRTETVDTHGAPRIRLVPHDWSQTANKMTPPDVTIRHPFSTFEWGYWTGKETPHLKPFYLTVAHEVCGHVAGWVRTGDRAVRGSATGHDVAIKGENEIAAEHGVKPDDLRGLDTTPKSIHHGESFLVASIPFSDASDALPREETREVLDDIVDSIKTVEVSSDPDFAPSLRLMIQVDGHALAAEGGGTGMATARASKVHDAIVARLKDEGIDLSFALGGATRSRLFADVLTVTDNSRPGERAKEFRADVFLFHNPVSGR